MLMVGLWVGQLFPLQGFPHGLSQAGTSLFSAETLFWLELTFIEIKGADKRLDRCHLLIFNNLARG